MTFALLLLLACSGSEDEPVPQDTSPPADTSTSDTSDTAVPRPVLSNPAEAVDIDPAEDVVHVELVAAPFTYTVGDQQIEGFAYNGQVPGPTIRAKVGDRVIVDLSNQLDNGTTIHWHGQNVPFAMDGVAWQGAPVQVGEQFRYEFVVQQAATTWYHPHFDTERQVDLGLYGAFIVEDPAEPVADHEWVLVFDSFQEIEAGQAEDHHNVDPTAQVWAVNGQVNPIIEVPGGESVRARMINVSNTSYVNLEDVRVIARDQGLLPAPEQSTLLLAPGDRAEVEWSTTTLQWQTSLYTVNGGDAFGEPLPLFGVDADGTGEAALLDFDFVAAPPSADPGTTDLRYTFTGSAAEGWEINGETFPQVTIAELARNSDVVIEVRNLSPAHHPFHLHGHHFEVLSIDGVAPPSKQIEDTIDVGIRQVVRLRLIADNPGDWMTHCHILPHAEQGMMTVIRVD